MPEWFLIISIALSATSTTFRDISVDTHSGFMSKQACETAGKHIGKTVLEHANQFRQKQGVTKNITHGIGYPQFLFDCLLINRDC